MPNDEIGETRLDDRIPDGQFGHGNGADGSALVHQIAQGGFIVDLSCSRCPNVAVGIVLRNLQKNRRIRQAAGGFLT